MVSRPADGSGIGIFGMRRLEIGTPTPRAQPRRGYDEGYDEYDPDDDPETVAVRNQGRSRPPMRSHDDPTVMRPHLSFLRDEAASDPATVLDPRAGAGRWRDDLADAPFERPPAPMPAAAERTSTTLSRAAAPDLDDPLPRRVQEEPSSSFDPRVAILAPLLVGSLGGLVFILLVLAVWAGSP